MGVLTSNTSQDLWSTGFAPGTVLSALCGFSCLVLVISTLIATLQVRKLRFGDPKTHVADHTGQVNTKIWTRVLCPNNHTGLPPNTFTLQGNQALVGFLSLGSAWILDKWVELHIKKASTTVWHCARSGGHGLWSCKDTEPVWQLWITLPRRDRLFWSTFTVMFVLEPVSQVPNRKGQWQRRVLVIYLTRPPTKAGDTNRGHCRCHKRELLDSGRNGQECQVKTETPDTDSEDL